MLNPKRVESALLFLTIFFLPTQLGKHFWFEFSFVYSLPIDYLSPTLYFWDILVFLLWVVFLAQGKSVNKLALILFYFFILTQALSLILNPQAIGAGLIRLEQYTVSGLFGVYVANLSLKNQISKLSLPLLLAVLFESTIAILQFLKAGSIGFWLFGERTFSISSPGIAKFDYFGNQFLRPYSTFPHPNVLAGFIVISIIILNLLNTLNKNRLNKVLLKVTTFLAGVATLLTVSRTAITAGLIYCLIFLRKKGKVLLLLVFITLLPIFYTRFSSLFNFDNLTFTRREELSVVALRIWLKSPFFGVGLNNFIPEAASSFLTGPNRFLQPVHNIFLLSLTETGIFGLIGLFLLIGFPIFKLFKLYPIPHTLSPILLIWAVIIFLGMFDHYFLTLPQGYRMLFLIWGLSFSMLKLRT